MKISHLLAFLIISSFIVFTYQQDSETTTVDHKEPVEEVSDAPENPAVPEEIQEEASEEEPSSTDTDNKNKTQAAPLILPQAKVILPIRRIGTSETELNAAPCGGIERMKADTLTNKGTNIHFVWETVVPAKGSNCTVQISKGLEAIDQFVPLYPADNSADKNGSFPCGRTKGFESQEFILPQDYECDQCILQWKWSTSYGDIYSCSDIIINGGNVTQCMAKCQNGGVCFNGKCMCLEGFSGEFCQKTEGKGVNRLLILLIIVALILVGLIVYYFINKKFFKSWTTSNKSGIKQPFTEDKTKNYNLDESGRQDNI